mmetsp:Transcript_46571/g.148683  ORF Transcript_46571/g.148683 Transcript_46571/m.148683 type:complete len:220 (-) Transcript_46571:352-1011(-)
MPAATTRQCRSALGPQVLASGWPCAMHWCRACVQRSLQHLQVQRLLGAQSAPRSVRSGRCSRQARTMWVDECWRSSRCSGGVQARPSGGRPGCPLTASFLGVGSTPKAIATHGWKRACPKWIAPHEGSRPVSLGGCSGQALNGGLMCTEAQTRTAGVMAWLGSQQPGTSSQVCLMACGVAGGLGSTLKAGASSECSAFLDTQARSKAAGSISTPVRANE